MSIIIKGLNLPKEELNQERLTITIWADGCVTNDGDWVLNEDGTYRKEYWNYEQFSAVKLPPHGRLIDADALHIDLIDRGIADIQTNDWYEIRQAVDDAPTIIESEGDNG